jgi:diaminohydroxyphosphoribosylaminopyrimidine deaminase/5-amino-6-(5-phosphoribosylamino)uracil reductase
VTVSLLELDAMRRAIALSAFGLGSTSPNPPVGCVILDRTGKIVGQGYHQRKGSAHAEVNALAAAGSRAHGGTALVTLEPCNHHGRTPPCHQALLDAGIVRIVIAVLDPTSRGDGGAARLRHAGVSVETGVLADEALLVLSPWLSALQTARPMVVWSYVIETDGSIGRSAVEQFDRTVDVVLHEDGTVEEIVAGSHGVGMMSLAPVNLTTGPQAVLAELYRGGARSVMLDGDLKMAEPFVAQGLVDQVVVYLAHHEPSSQPLLGDAFFLPAGFRLTETTRCEGYVRVVGVLAASDDGGE